MSLADYADQVAAHLPQVTVILAATLATVILAVAGPLAVIVFPPVEFESGRYK